MRAKRDILRRSTIGAMFTNRNQSSLTAGGSNQAYGVDAAFGFYQNVSLGGYYARTETTGLGGDAGSFQGKFDWVPDRYGVRAEVLKVGKDFNPEVGFLRRTDFTRSFASARFSPRPRSLRSVRKFTFEGLFESYENGAGAVESRQQTWRLNVELDNSDVLNIEANANYDLLVLPFSPAAGASIPAGGYHYNDLSLSYNMGQQRRLSGNVGLQLGEYYNGTITGLTFSQGRFSILKQLSVEPRVTLNRIELPSGRFRWEYRPGSEFFVVWTDEQDTHLLEPSRGRIALKNRAFVVKMTRLFRF